MPKLVRLCWKTKDINDNVIYFSKLMKEADAIELYNNEVINICSLAYLKRKKEFGTREIIYLWLKRPGE